MVCHLHFGLRINPLSSVGLDGSDGTRSNKPGICVTGGNGGPGGGGGGMERSHGSKRPCRHSLDPTWLPILQAVIVPSTHAA